MNGFDSSKPSWRNSHRLQRVDADFFFRTGHEELGSPKSDPMVQWLVISSKKHCQFLGIWIFLIGLREHLQENPIFNGKIYGFRLRFSLKPIH
jgi:hypothetical protein